MKNIDKVTVESLTKQAVDMLYVVQGHAPVGCSGEAALLYLDVADQIQSLGRNLHRLSKMMPADVAGQ